MLTDVLAFTVRKWEIEDTAFSHQTQKEKYTKISLSASIMEGKK